MRRILHGFPADLPMLEREREREKEVSIGINESASPYSAEVAEKKFIFAKSLPALSDFV